MAPWRQKKSSLKGKWNQLIHTSYCFFGTGEWWGWMEGWEELGAKTKRAVEKVTVPMKVCGNLAANGKSLTFASQQVGCL